MPVINGRLVPLGGSTSFTSAGTVNSNIKLLLNFNADLTDATGKTVTGIDGIAISTSEKKFGAGSCYFNGSTQYLELANSSDWDFGSEQFCIELWMKSANNGSYPSIIGKGNDYWHLFLNAGKIYWYVNGAGHNGNGIITDNVWHHIVINRQADGFTRLYVDGVSDAAFKYSDSVNYADPVSSVFRIGKDASGNHAFSSYMDCIRVTKGDAIYKTGDTSFTPPSEELTNTTVAPIVVSQYTGIGTIFSI